MSVPHDEAHQRIAATIAAGGTLIYDAEAPAFWVLADPEGNEACITDPGRAAMAEPIYDRIGAGYLGYRVLVA